MIALKRETPSVLGRAFSYLFICGSVQRPLADRSPDLVSALSLRKALRSQRSALLNNVELVTCKFQLRRLCERDLLPTERPNSNHNIPYLGLFGAVSKTVDRLRQGDSKNRILQGLTRLSNQILSASQRQTLEALTDAHALGCFE